MVVYYLPPPADQGPEALRAPPLRERLQRAWWRLCVAVVEIRGILRPGSYLPRPDLVGMFEAGEVPGRERRPGRVTDLESARRRRATHGPRPS